MKDSIQFLPPTLYAVKTKTALLAPATGETLEFLGATVQNRSGSNMVAGVAFRQPSDFALQGSSNAMWKAGQWVDAAGTRYSDDSTDAQDATVAGFPLTTLTNNDGFAIQSKTKFNIVSMLINTATAGGAPVFSYEYFNGTTWTVLGTSAAVGSLISLPSFATASEAETVLAFGMPTDWALGGASGDGIDATRYAIRMKATTAPTTTAPIASQMFVGTLYDFIGAAISDDPVSFATEDDDCGIVLTGEFSGGIAPYFATANALNTVSIRYRVRRG